MPSFAESFIRGHARGSMEADRKKRLALDEEEFKARQEENKQRAEEHKQQMEVEKAISTLNFQMKAQELLRQTKRPTQTAKEAGFLEQPPGPNGEEMGGPSPSQISVPKQTPPTIFDLSALGGGKVEVPQMFAEDVAKQNLTEKEAEAALKLKTDVSGYTQKTAIENAPVDLVPEASKYLGTKEKSLTPQNIKILTEKAKEDAALKKQLAAADARANADRIKAASNRTPLTDEFGNFTGQLIDKTGNLSSNPALSGLRGKPLTGQTASRVHQAAVVEDTGTMLLNHLQDEDVAKRLGPVMGRITHVWQLWGDPDPEVHRFATELASFAALQPALHGFRGQNALKEFDKMIGGIKMTPDALSASIQGIMDVGGIIQKSASRKTDDELADEYLASLGGKK